MSVSIAFLLLAAQSPAEVSNNLIPMQTAYKHCIAEQTVALGRGNHETADTVLRAVAAACRPAEQNLVALYRRLLLPDSHIVGLIVRDRKLGEDAGVAELLRVRAAQP